MEVLNCDMFQVCKNDDALCVTTNGVLNKQGNLVMGAGNAKYFRDNFKGIDKKLGNYVKKYGNRVFKIGEVTLNTGNIVKIVTLFSFPTKHDWKDSSDLKLIEQSCIQLKEVVEKFKIKGNVYLPAPGCANGGLDWEKQVKPIVEKYLNDNKYKICFYTK